MSKDLESMTIDELMAEADKLMQQIDSEFMDDMEEDRRLRLEKHAENLSNMKTVEAEKTNGQRLSETGFGAEGMHEAILDIVKAFREFNEDIS